MYFLSADRYGGNPNEPQLLIQQDSRKFSIIDWHSGGGFKNRPKLAKSQGIYSR